MDDSRFDDLARLLGAGMTRRGGLRAALGGLLGAGAALGLGAAGRDADARPSRKGRADDTDAYGRRRRKTCKPACTAGFDCVKQGKKRRCVCSTGVTCGEACCPTGQVCRNDACVVPEACIAPGQPCKGVGVRCCDGRTCASGQGGEADVACHVPKTGPCAATDDCVYGTTCVNGRCSANGPAPAPLGGVCEAGTAQACATPGAVCTPYDGAGAPAGPHCSLPLGAVCTGDPECTCYHCGVPNVAGSGSRVGALACCRPEGGVCQSDSDCCAGLACPNGTCATASCDVDPACPTPGSGCWTSIAAAYADVAAKPAGSTITIAPGTYSEPLIDLNRNIVFRRCSATGTVVWQNTQRDQDEEPLVTVDDASLLTSVAFHDIEFTANPDYPQMAYLFEITGDTPTHRLALTATNCVWRDYNYSSGYTAIDVGSNVDLDLTDCVFRDLGEFDSGGAAIRASSSDRSTISLTRCQFTDNTAGDAGGAIELKNVSLTATGCSFSGNTAGRGGGAILLDDDGDGPASATLTDCTLTGNTAGTDNDRYGGGAIWVCPTCTLTIAGTTTINGSNTATNFGGGIRVAVDQNSSSQTKFAPARITGTTTSNVTGNVSPNCQVWGYENPTPKFEVTCSGWCVPTGQPCETGVTTCCTQNDVCVPGAPATCGQLP